MRLLFIKKGTDVSELIRVHGDEFDNIILDHLTVSDEAVEGYDLVSVYIVPYTEVDVGKLFYGFGKVDDVDIFRVIPITDDDFIAQDDTEIMSLNRSSMGRFITWVNRDSDAQLISAVAMPLWVGNKAVFFLKFQGDNIHAINHHLSKFGSLLGGITEQQLKDGDIFLSDVSKEIVDGAITRS
jgi:hypothetical protein